MKKEKHTESELTGAPTHPPPPSHPFSFLARNFPSFAQNEQARACSSPRKAAVALTPSLVSLTSSVSQSVSQSLTLSLTHSLTHSGNHLIESVTRTLSHSLRTVRLTLPAHKLTLSHCGVVKSFLSCARCAYVVLLKLHVRQRDVDEAKTSKSAAQALPTVVQRSVNRVGVCVCAWSTHRLDEREQRRGLSRWRHLS